MSGYREGREMRSDVKHFAKCGKESQYYCKYNHNDCYHRWKERDCPYQQIGNALKGIPLRIRKVEK